MTDSLSAAAGADTGGSSSTAPLIRVRNLVFHRGDRPIFDGVNLDIHRGRITGIMGPSGTGKTTLLRLIGGQLLPDAGEVWFDDQRIDTLGRAALFKARSRMGM
ncbi:MAG: hypothetical protein RL180_770, partial [Pseudomonadota bacterium]